MNDNLAYMDEPIQSLLSTKYDINLYIDIDFVDVIECGSRNPDRERKTKEIFVKYFKYAVPELFRNDSRFYVDYEHDGDKTSFDITKSGHTKSESNYIVLYAKNAYGFVINSWIVQLRIGEHKTPTDNRIIEDEDGTDKSVDIRKESKIQYLDDSDRFWANLKIDKETFAKIKKKQVDIIVNCGISSESNVTVRITQENTKRFNNCEKALKYIDNYRNTLYNQLSSEITEFFYKSYRIAGSESSCTIYDLYDNVIQSDVTMGNAKSIIDDITKDKPTSPVYGAESINSTFTKRDLVEFANKVIYELNPYITNQKYYIYWTDIHFEFDFSCLSMTVVDSNGYEFEAYITEIEFDDFSTDETYRAQCRIEFVDQITEAYSEVEY